MLTWLLSQSYNCAVMGGSSTRGFVSSYIYPQWFSDGGGNGLKSHLNKLTLSLPNNLYGW